MYPAKYELNLFVIMNLRRFIFSHLNFLYLIYVKYRLRNMCTGNISNQTLWGFF